MEINQLIQKPEINIVGIIVDGQFSWYLCSSDMWIMDIDKYIQSYKDAGWNFDFSYLPGVKNKLHVVSKANVDAYLQMYKDEWTKLTVADLISVIKTSMSNQSHSEIILEGAALLPDLLINFDEKVFYDNHLGMRNYERYVPDGWKVFSGRFEHLITKNNQYWVEKDGYINVK